MRMTQRAHEAVRAVVRPGDLVVDATVGNGHDTLFLAQLVGSTGRVVGFDIQEEALGSARQRLAKASEGIGTVDLHLTGHEKLAVHVPTGVAVVMFNLGYLPGGDHEFTTKLDSTQEALQSAWELLREGGLVSVVCYRGHPGGYAEAEAVVQTAEQLEGAEVLVQGKDETEDGPFLVLVRKLPAP